MRVLGRVVAIIVAVTVIGAAVAVVLITRHGVSARSEPTVIEATIARSMRHLATPAAMRNAPNPVRVTPQAMADARAHWADHCASCHGNDGSGQTEMGRSLYPKAPDMRKAETQDRSDGELFSIIKNGVRLTGMPAWGDPSGSDDAETWKLVHFVRHLPKLTADEIAAMEKLNPRSPEEWQAMQDEAAFLAGSQTKH